MSILEKSKYINLFNNILRGNPLPFNEEVLPIISEYLTEVKFENSDKIINLILQQPQLASNIFPELIEYYCRKYNIFSIIFNNKTILYYE